MPNKEDQQKTTRKYLQEEVNQAADLIRHKLNNIYSKEPNASEEARESETASNPSKHQKYMNELSASGKSVAEIQTAWHEYYQSLSDKEKHQVWQEFYEVHDKQSSYAKATVTPPQQTAPELKLPPIQSIPHNGEHIQKSLAELKEQITSKVRVRGKLTKKQHLKSILFGLSLGSLTVLILLFGFFNERFIAPFITPSRNVSSTPLILDPNSSSVDPSPQIIIPKINAQSPVVYDVPTIDEKDVQTGLERGVVHYITTPNPGEQGNAVFFGHSSGNIFNRGKYKFIFVLLSLLDNGDTFYVQKDGVRYVYKVIDKKVVKPTDVDVLNSYPGKSATATLITCDPPGTNVNRLVVTGEQISPDPVKNIASTAKTEEKPSVLAGNSESLWHRLINAIF